ncbi:MAG TPA: nucleoside-diphosphate kinase [Clostridiaceae bacterium]|nr:nucleoside-diphosphate kinase [Clostridiaceae bacterium]
MERTFVLIKPDAVERRLIGEIISIYEKKSFQITAMKIIKPSREIAENHYIDHKEKPFFENLVNYITRGEVCALILEGTDVVEMVRKMNGATNPLNAETGSIRGRFGISMSENTVHASENMESAEREIKIWFPEKMNWESRLCDDLIGT